MEGKIVVLVRIRPLMAKEKKSQVCKNLLKYIFIIIYIKKLKEKISFIDESNRQIELISENKKINPFTFDRIYNEKDTTELMYNEYCYTLVNKVNMFVFYNIYAKNDF